MNSHHRSGIWQLRIEDHPELESIPGDREERLHPLDRWTALRLRGLIRRDPLLLARLRSLLSRHGGLAVATLDEAQIVTGILRLAGAGRLRLYLRHPDWSSLSQIPQTGASPASSAASDSTGDNPQDGSASQDAQASPSSSQPDQATETTENQNTENNDQGSEDNSGSPDPAAAADPAPEKTWIEIQLVGEDDKPIPGERYQIRRPDGSLAEGKLDANGLARLDQLDPGDCDVCFPDLDQDAWMPIDDAAGQAGGVAG